MLPFLLERAKREGTPLFDGRLTRTGALFDSSRAECQVTFVWHGKTAPALTGDFCFWAGDSGGASGAPLELDEIAPRVWARTMTFPRNAYVEYVFLRNGKRANDPLNSRTSRNGMGGRNNSFFAPHARPTPFLKPRSGIARGRVTTHMVQADGLVIGNRRKVHLYQPPTQEPSPLIVALDGQDYLRRAKLPTLLDNLISAGKIPPLSVAMIENTHVGKGSGRMSEYACSELTLLFILKRLVPFAQERLNLLDPNARAGAYGIMGASMGGLMSLFTALRAPGVFGTVISHAGAFELWDTDVAVYALAAQATLKPRVWLDVGQMDWLLRANRKMHTALEGLDFETSYREYYAYHNWPAWRDVLPDALMWAFGRGDKDG